MISAALVTTPPVLVSPSTIASALLDPWLHDSRILDTMKTS